MYRIVLLGLAAIMLIGLAVAASGRLSATPSAQVAPTPAETQSRRPDQVGDYDPSLIPGMARVADKAFILRSAVWSSNSVPVCFESAAEAASPEAKLVRDAVTGSWEAASKIRFEGWGACAPNAVGIRIAVTQEGPHTKGLGNQIDGVRTGMVLNRQFTTWSPSCASSPAKREACIRSIAVHEFGHAIGFSHEQNRFDAPGECAKLRQGSNGDVMLTAYDPSSVMNYCNPVYNNDGRLSALDASSVKSLYR